MAAGMSGSRRDPTAQDIWQARRRIAGHVAPTPLVRAASLCGEAADEVLLKLEQVHEIGAFKLRGAANKLLALTPGERRRGVVTFSTGNHGLGVACMARRLRTRAVVCVPQGVPEVKLQSLRAYGATIEVAGPSQDDAARRAAALRDEDGLTLVEPFDDPAVIAGQGTIGLELLSDVPDLDAVLVPVSGGGLIAGVALALKANSPRTRIIGVSAEHARAMHESVRVGLPVHWDERPTLADSLLGGIGGQNRHTLRMVQRLVDEMVLVSEDEIRAAMLSLLRNERMVVEGAAAVGVAALLAGRVRTRRRQKVATVITGRNVAAPVLQELAQHLALDA